MLTVQFRPLAAPKRVSFARGFGEAPVDSGLLAAGAILGIWVGLLYTAAKRQGKL